MPWVNMFDLGECDIYVQWQDYDNPGPGSSQLCLASDLPIEVGTVEIVDGEVVCTFNYVHGGSSGWYPKVYCVPKYDYSAATSARVIEVSATGDEPPQAGGDYIGRCCVVYIVTNETPYPADFWECPGYAEANMGTIPPDESGFVFGAEPGPIPPLADQEPGDMPCIGATYYFPGS